jgi:hypothetical protein
VLAALNLGNHSQEVNEGNQEIRETLVKGYNSQGNWDYSSGMEIEDDENATQTDAMIPSVIHSAEVPADSDMMV